MNTGIIKNQYIKRGDTLTLRDEYITSLDVAPQSDRKIVAIGGGTGMSTMLGGLKELTGHITAVVTMADDGGGSGKLREDMGILPPGDVRNCILGLAKADPIMKKLLNYRFTEGSLEGQSFGNLFLAAMCGISSNFEEAVKRVSDVLKVTGRVLPVTLEDVNLKATYADGNVLVGESIIPKYAKKNNTQINRIEIVPGEAKPLDDVITAISEADAVVIGPGSLYTSILPNLLINGVADAVKNTRAIKIFICNLMTQPGETTGMSAYEHIMALYEHVGDLNINYCLANNLKVQHEFLKPYLEDGATEIVIDEDRIKQLGIEVVYGNFVSLQKSLLRHDCKNLAKTIMSCVD